MAADNAMPTDSGWEENIAPSPSAPGLDVNINYVSPSVKQTGLAFVMSVFTMAVACLETVWAGLEGRTGISLSLS